MILFVLATLLVSASLCQEQNLTPNFKSRSPETYQVNLDLAPRFRYTKLIDDHGEQIKAFLNYLNTNNLYNFLFQIQGSLEPLLPQLVDYEFYQECDGIASALGVPTSQLIIFNYMYELGAYHDFCTSVTAIRTENGESLLARNLDYGFQKYLANSSVTLVYKKNDRELFRTAGHAGLIGTHTAFKNGKYAVSLNQRIDGGLRKTLYQVVSGCKQVPFLLRKTMELCQDVNCALYSLRNSQLCAPVYFIVSSPTEHTVIERSRNSIHNQYNLKSFDGARFLVQTNTDRNLPDPDKRRTVAQQRLGQLGSIDEVGLFGVLKQYPNLNPLSLFTVVMNVEAGYFNTTIWWN